MSPFLWRAMRRLPAPDPAELAERNRPETAAELSAALGEFVTDLLGVAHIAQPDRDHLVDLEQRLLRLASTARIRGGDELAPYTGPGITNEVVVLEAQRLLDGGNAAYRLAAWSTLASDDASALEWFAANLYRIADSDTLARSPRRSSRAGTSR